MGALWLDLDRSSCFFITVIHSIFLGLSFTCQIYTLSVILILNKTPWNDFSHFFSNERRLVLPVDQLMMKWISRLRNWTKKIVITNLKIEKCSDKKKIKSNLSSNHTILHCNQNIKVNLWCYISLHCINSSTSNTDKCTG